MKNIFRQVGIIFIFFCIWYLFFLLLTYFFYSDNGEFGNNKKWPRINGPTRTIFPDGGANIDLGFWVSQHAPHRIIITGASNAGEGIKPSIMQKMLPDFTIYNATVGGLNITELRQIFDVARMSNPGSMKGTIFVVGIFFGTFFNDHTHAWHVLVGNKNLTPLQADGLRYGLYKAEDNKMRLMADPYFMPLTVRLLRPFLMWHLIFHDLKGNYDVFWANLKHQDPKGEAARQNALALWKSNLGDIKDYAEDQEMNDFSGLCKDIEQSGATVVIVDLPIPQWLHERSEYYKKYVIKRPLFLNKIKEMPRVLYIDLGTNVADSTDLDFRDSVHPSKEGAKAWSKTMGDFVLSQRQFLGF